MLFCCNSNRHFKQDIFQETIRNSPTHRYNMTLTTYLDFLSTKQSSVEITSANCCSLSKKIIPSYTKKKNSRFKIISISGIYNQAFGHEISGNPLYEGCNFTESMDEPGQFTPSSLVSPNPLYGDMDDFPGDMTRQKGTEVHVIC